MEFVFDNNTAQNMGNRAQPMSMSSSNTINGSAINSTSARRTSRRNLPSSIDDIEITGARKRTRKAASPAKVNYVKTKKKSSRTANFIWTWHKFWWMVATIAFLRLLLMENGVIDYYKVENSIENNHQVLSLIQNENAELVTEIHKIQTSARYQKKLARDHLGVIAPGEYLILFAKDSAESSI